MAGPNPDARDDLVIPAVLALWLACNPGESMSTAAFPEPTPVAGPFSGADYASWGLGGEWAWPVGGKDQLGTFSVEGGQLVLRAPYGEFRGGASEDGRWLVLTERSSSGPPLVTTVLLARDRDGLAGFVAARGGDESEPLPTRMTRR